MIYSDRRLHADLQVPSTVKIAVQLDKILFSGWRTAPTDEVRGLTETYGSVTEYQIPLTDMIGNDERRLIMRNTSEEPKPNEDKLGHDVSVIPVYYCHLNCRTFREEFQRTFSCPLLSVSQRV